MPEAIALQMIVFHFAYPFDAQRLPRKIFACAPAALCAGHARGIAACPGPVAPGVSGQCVLPERLQFARELATPLHREGRGHADMVERAFVVVQAE